MKHVIDITIGIKGYRAQINDKYVETNSLDKLMEHISEEDIARIEKHTEEHLENNDYSGREFDQEPTIGDWRSDD